MARLLDANIVLRVLVSDTSNSDYNLCLKELLRGGVIKFYVFPEIVAQAAWYFRRSVAEELAIRLGELNNFKQDVRKYTQEHVHIENGHRKFYIAFCEDLDKLLHTYPNVSIEHFDLVKRVLTIAVNTGLDLVDCLLVVEQIENDAEIVTCDKALQRELDARRANYPGKFTGSVGEVHGFKLE